MEKYKGEDVDQVADLHIDEEEVEMELLKETPPVGPEKTPQDADHLGRTWFRLVNLQQWIRAVGGLIHDFESLALRLALLAVLIQKLLVLILNT